jgi:hypothetical protein
MKRKRFSEGQMIGVLKEQEAGVKTVDLRRKKHKGCCNPCLSKNPVP